MPGRRCPLDALGALEISELFQCFPVEVILLVYVVIHDVLQELVRTVVVRFCLGGGDNAIRHASGAIERESELVGYLQKILRPEHASMDALARNHRECAGEEASGVQDIERLAATHPLAVSRIIPIGEDERPAAALHETIVGGIDDAPLHAVPQIPE